MSADYEFAREQISELAVWAAAHHEELTRNEADTRLHLIDRLLFDCLGWDRDECRCEQEHGGSFADYTLGKPPSLILEAKREGIYFELPTGFEKRVARIATVTEANGAIRKAIEQAAGYCKERGVGTGAICNGHQVVAFIASRQDGTPPMEGCALVFTSLEDMRDSFRELWENLSKPGTVARTLYTTLKGDFVPPPPKKLADRLHTYPGFKNRNPFQTELQILGEMLLEDVGRDPALETDFLTRCYCASGALSQYASVSKQILQTRYSALFQKEMEIPNLQAVADKGGIRPELSADILAANLKSRPIILLGDVGVGKTIFIRACFKNRFGLSLGTYA